MDINEKGNADLIAIVMKFILFLVICIDKISFALVSQPKKQY